MRFKIRQHSREITGPLQHRSRGLPQIDAHLVGNDMRKRRFSKARRTKYQNMVQGFSAPPCCFDKNAHLLFDAGLADVLR